MYERRRRRSKTRSQVMLQQRLMGLLLVVLSVVMLIVCAHGTTIEDRDGTGAFKVIIPELHYNNSRMSQFYMRFIRFTSERMKDIYFVTYLGSIESNQMQMVLAKEKINMFMRGKDTDLDEIYNRFGVDYNLLSALMSREMDENGKFHIRWGEQEIA